MGCGKEDMETNEFIDFDFSMMHSHDYRDSKSRVSPCDRSEGQEGSKV